MENFKGWKTLIVSLTQVVLGVMAFAGYATPEGLDVELSNEISNIIGSILTVSGLVHGYLRTITNTPVGKAE